jgi:catechol 2,3-dioxygenase
MQRRVTYPVNPVQGSIDPGTDLGLVALTVGDFEGSLTFYQDVMGFKVLQQEAGRAVLGAGEKPLLVLREQAGAPPSPRSATGLYHFAILLPSRADLGRWLLHLAETGYPLGGASDHLVSEALYLSDPEDNGIEVYRDRRRDEWPRDAEGNLQMATDPLDLHSVIAQAQADPKPWAGLPEGARLGHMHLQVADIAKARDFYHGVIGFDIMFDWEPMGALFISAGGYHHHLGLNTWHSKGSGPAPEGSGGLRYFTVVLPGQDALSAILARLDNADVAYRNEDGGVVVEDPFRNKILLLTSPSVPTGV